jgi:DNA-binding Lrp family transcriptional regulator
MGEALEYVYDESDQLDRKIIEMTTGYGGVTMLQKNQIAIKLGISPSQVTRRSERIGVKLQEMDQDITSTYS